MKFILYLLLMVFCTVSAGLTQDDSEEWVTVKKSQLMEWANLIIDLRSRVNEYSVNITVLQMEILRLQNDNLELKKLYDNARKGFWFGVGTGYPMGGQGTVIYQFNERFGLFVISGYSSVWMVNAGFIARIK